MDQPVAAEIVNLHKTFKTGLGKPVVHAVRGIDMNIRQGEVYGLIGPNGSGKSTLMKALLGLVSAILLSMTVFLTTGMLAKPRGKKSFYYQAGLMERTEGFLAFTAMMLFPAALEALTWIYGGLIGVTIVQRLWEARKIARECNEQEEQQG